ncbi:nicotinamide mononucleotide transporter [Thalassolituus sp. ST750PaO-4]|uniref:nicotinamide riboside transporter PnuC n=1 Tax=Thalassolituus sp. ST750PaO-4 TaxID=2742965 RepID=UPI000C4D140B|nr:nicotinamide riboside transporter PnuC [Thalassolituus sp. ST750PaO-4]MCA6061667.1 nicotinamide mononucleotide transporter [Thalassolituus sp. ST750PaO-4]PIQ41933.1 MAG: nicotinamide mononucleotide transporter [Thalassolituus sp. CG17_big_fil_post_rev_8_21_14_2_50_53_8]
MSALEIACNLITTISILLAGRNSVHTWWTGIIGCVLFGLLFFQAQLYADVTLQIFFVATSAYGWMHWRRGNNGQARPVTRAGLRHVALIAPLGLLVASLYALILHRFTDAYAPLLDSLVLTFSVIAQWLLMQRRLEAWWFWLLVNTIAVPLFASRELYLTSFLYACYWVNAIIAFFYWRSLLTKDIDATTSANAPA